MRLFVAVEISDEMRHVAARTVDRLRRTLAHAIDARWLEPDTMHLTVRFIGHVDDDRVTDVLKILSTAVDVDPFDVALGRCGVFPPSGALRVIWIGLAAGLPSLTALHDEYDRRLAPLGFEPETRPYSAHLTLARVKGMKEARPAALREAIRHVTVEPAQCVSIAPRCSAVTHRHGEPGTSRSRTRGSAAAAERTEYTDKDVGGTITVAACAVALAVLRCRCLR